jgi:hypothetical protein
MSPTPLWEYASYAIDTRIDPAAVTAYGGLLVYWDLMALTDLPGLLQRACPPGPAKG